MNGPACHKCGGPTAFGGPNGQKGIDESILADKWVEVYTCINMNCLTRVELPVVVNKNEKWHLTPPSKTPGWGHNI